MDESEEEKSMLDSIDTESLIEEVKKRPGLWDNHSKDYNDAVARKTAWIDLFTSFFPNYEDFDDFTKTTIANQVQTKWFNLRSSYGRYLRSIRTLSGSKKMKKYIHADSMSFINKNIKPKLFKRRKVETDNDTTTDNSNDANKGHNHKSVSYIEESVSGDEEMLKGCHNNKAPLSGYISEKRKTTEEDPMVSFFKSLLPDATTLNSKRRRMFKGRMLEILNELLDDEDHEKSLNATSQLYVSDCYSLADEEQGAEECLY